MEIWDAYHADGTLAGVDLVRGEPVPEGLYHMTCEILVRHTDGSYLLMRRDPNKLGYPGWWEATAGGSALKGEDSLTCARRELREETGIASGEFTLLCRGRCDDTFYFDYLCVTDWDKSAVTLQPGETVAFKWLNETEFVNFVNSPDVIDSQKKRYLAHYLSNRDSL